MNYFAPNYKGGCQCLHPGSSTDHSHCFVPRCEMKVPLSLFATLFLLITFSMAFIDSSGVNMRVKCGAYRTNFSPSA